MSDSAEYYCLDFARLPDELYTPQARLEEWQKHLKTAGSAGFSKGSLGEVAPCSWIPFIERTITFPIYMLLNAAPFMMPPLIWGICGWRGMGYFAAGLAGTHVLLTALDPMKSVRSGQYLYTERNIQKYNSVKWVWPKSLQPPNMLGPKIFVAIPHGLAPVGITAYPGWSKLFGERLNHWTAAPVVLKLPVVSYFLKRVGYVNAASKDIKKVLAKEENVALALDGIAGMFQKDKQEEIGYVKSRKGIVKIALTMGTPIVPVFGFGHSELWRIVVDPFGILEKISLFLNVSVTPFFGRPFGLLPFGPPFRVPILMAFGEPVVCPKIEDPTNDVIDEYHQKMMESFSQAFNAHKAAYGWPTKTLKLV